MSKIAEQNMALLLPRTYAAITGKTAPAPAPAADAAPEASMQINNTTATSPLWETVWTGGVVDKTRRLMASLRPLFMDVSTGFDVSNPKAMPITKINVLNSIGSAREDVTDWEQSNINEKWVDCQTHRISVSFSMTLKEIQNGATVRDKVAAAGHAAALGVLNRLYKTIQDAGISPVAKPAMTPEVATELSALFDDKGETDVLLLDASSRAKLLKVYDYNLDPNKDGVFDIGMIRKCTMLDTGWNGLALSAGGIGGMIAEPDLSPLTGLDVQRLPLGEEYGISLVLKTWLKPGEERIWFSVETVCGFTVADPDRIVPLTFQSAAAAATAAAAAEESEN